MALLDHETRLVFVDQDAFDRFLERTACAVKRQPRNNSKIRDASVPEAKRMLDRIFAPMIQNEHSSPEPGSIEGATAQDIYDKFKNFRRRMIPIKWEEFTEPPRWVHNVAGDQCT
jgi:hypothetical protein